MKNEYSSQLSITINHINLLKHDNNHIKHFLQIKHEMGIVPNTWSTKK